MKDYSILIVDDEDAQRSILKGYLEKKVTKYIQLHQAQKELKLFITIL